MSEYKVEWSEKDKGYVGLCPEYPRLSWLAETEAGALKGIKKLVEDIERDVDKGMKESLNGNVIKRGSFIQYI